MRVIPRARMEGLTDGIFGTVMTVLVIDIDLPEGVKYTSNDQMLADLGELADLARFPRPTVQTCGHRGLSQWRTGSERR